MQRFTIEISWAAYEALRQRAHQQHRSFRQQAAVIVEQAVLPEEAAPPRDDRTPRLTELRVAQQEIAADA